MIDDRKLKTNDILSIHKEEGCLGSVLERNSRPFKHCHYKYEVDNNVCETG